LTAWGFKEGRNAIELLGIKMVDREMSTRSSPKVTWTFLEQRHTKPGLLLSADILHEDAIAVSRNIC
jgi:hypothetical protein